MQIIRGSSLHYVRFMWLFAIILALTIWISDYDLFVSIYDLTNILHSACLRFTPESTYSNMYAALVCGKPLLDADFSQSLKNLGIFHIMIVSGSHLVFLSSLIENLFNRPKFEKLKAIALPILITYSLCTNAQPPVIRAVISISIDLIQRKKKLFWNHSEVILISTLICLSISNPWENSYSLLLSYAAAVAMDLSKTKNSLLKNTIIYILILPFLLPMNAPHPLSILSNMTLAPLIGTIYFPLSFVAYLIPYSYKLIDPLWKTLIETCNLLGSELQSLEQMPVALPILWCIVFTFNFYGITKNKKGFYDSHN